MSIFSLPADPQSNLFSPPRTHNTLTAPTPCLTFAAIGGGELPHSSAPPLPTTAHQWRIAWCVGGRRGEGACERADPMRPGVAIKRGCERRMHLDDCRPGWRNHIEGIMPSSKVPRGQLGALVGPLLIPLSSYSIPLCLPQLRSSSIQ